MLQSEIVRSFAGGSYTLAISNWNNANNLPSPVEDDFRAGAVLDIAGALTNSSVTLNVQLDVSIDGVLVPLARAGPFDMAFVDFSASGDTNSFGQMRLICCASS